ncbi:MAG: hypothetical protein JNL51_02200, partial [Chitinophagaceae bacterium]|nr:hypothetical protein [Chitinophagaceae bacterium]
MKRTIKLSLRHGICFIVALLMGRDLFATGDPTVKFNVLNGNLNQIKVDSTVVVSDSSLLGAVSFSAVNKVSLKIDETDLNLLQGPFTAVVGLHITASVGGGTVNYDTTLTINYDSLGTYVQEHAFYFNDAFRVEAKITSVSTNVGWNVWKSLRVYNEIKAIAFYSLNCSEDVIDVINSESLPSNTGNDQLLVTWASLPGADEYDLEWTYIDDSALVTGQYGNPASPVAAKIFQNNASRVTIKTEMYKIPLIYDGKGALFFRVRAAQVTADGGRKEANWSAQTPGRFNFDGHERSLNWQATTSYAEEGKRKTVVQYYDGSLRSRQTVTKDNTRDTTIVAESFYDYQGRPVIQVLPTPSLDNIIKYSKNFNTGINGSEYDKDNYDAITNPAAYCVSSADSMSITSGASRYYSANNPLKNSGMHRFIPNARRYPFTEVQYMPDNTGRISKQSGVGLTHKLGSGHETSYYYGSPDQNELDALFGTEVGDASHYSKTMVRDANGQFSVSYIDMRGRTIATALAGVPTQAQLDTLSSYTSGTITENLANPEGVVIKGLVMESKKSLLVAKPGNHVFDYQLTPESLAMEGCSESVCYDCAYDLRITIADNCNNQAFGGTPFDTTVANFTIGLLDELCNGQGFSFSFTKYLPEGSYEITKQLSLSRSALEYYRDSIATVKNSCKTMEDFIQEQRLLLAVDTTCQADCSSCRASLVSWETFRHQFMVNGGIVSDTASYRGIAWAAYTEALANCDALCGETPEYDDIKKAMLADLTPPSGQYANLDSASTDVYSIFYANVHQPGTYIIAKYQEVSDYRDEEGNLDWVFDEEAGAYVQPQQLSPSAFVQKFKASWAEALLSSHPEYCKWTKYEALKQSFLWDRRFESTDTYSEAYALGYLNPTDGTSSEFTKYTSWSPGAHPDRDPLSAGLLNGHNYKPDLETQIKRLDNNVINTSGISMWGIASVTAKCIDPGATSCYTSFGSNAGAFDASQMCAGDLDAAWRFFRQMYLDVKRNLINTQLQVCGNPSASDLWEEGHGSHFSDAKEMLELNDIDLPTGAGDTTAFKQRFKTDISNYYDTTCRAYAKQWLEQLKGCGYSNIAKDTIISRLVQVCKNGSDEAHPYGSSSVSPASTYIYKSFEDVITSYNNANGIANSSECTADNITAPRPYNQQTIYSDKPIWSKPDSCECVRVAYFHAQYKKDSALYSGFSDYMQQKIQVSIPDSTLSYLVNSCNTQSSTCNYLQRPIQLPPVFQCNAGDICVDCSEINTGYRSFVNKYPSVIPVANPTDSLQEAHNKLFENYLNARFGFDKSTSEYLEFLNECYGDSAHSYSYDTLSRWELDFKKYGGTPHFDAGGCDTTRWKFNYGGHNFTVPVQLSHVFKDGYAQIPDTVQYTGMYDWDYYYPFCVDSSGFDWETRIKLPDSTYIPNGNNSIVWIRLNTSEEAGGSLLAGFSFYDSTYDGGFCTHNKNGNPLQECQVYPGFKWRFNDFRTVKFSFRNRDLKLYVDDSMVYQRSFDTVTTKVFSWSFEPFSRAMVVDYIKIRDTAGNFIYNEEFNGCENLAIPKSTCPGECQAEFTTYFNSQRGTTYSYNQIDSIYAAVMKRRLNACEITNNECDSLRSFITKFNTNASPYKMRLALQ